MKAHPNGKVLATQIFGILAFFSVVAMLGCKANETNSTATVCTAGTAQIFVYEGVFKRVCGCTEGAGTFSSGSSLTCTVTAGTRIFFHFINIQTQHQIAVTGIGSTRPYDVNPQVVDQVDATILIPATGTYPFSDIYFPSMTGNFIVP